MDVVVRVVNVILGINCRNDRELVVNIKDTEGVRK